MIKRLLNLLISMVFFTSITAQMITDIKGYVISGKITEILSEKPVPYSTIQIFNNHNKTVSVVTSDTSGFFSIHVKSLGRYMLYFYAMEYVPDSLAINVSEASTNIGAIRLHSDSRQLSAVTISAKKLIMKDEGDRLVYDVTNDPDARRVKMADIMKKIPFMTINGGDGKFKYLNDPLTTILINGQRNEMISGVRQFPMRLIKGDVMSKIEIILPGTKDNPGERPIVNIKLSKELPEGYAAELATQGNTQNSTGGNLDFITKFEKLYVSLIYGINYQNKPKLESFTSKENLTDGAQFQLQNNNSISWGNILSHRLGIGTTYQITKKDNVSLSLSTNKSIANNYNNTSSKNYDFQNVLLDYQNSNSKNIDRSSPKINASFNYIHTLKNNGSFVISYNLLNNLNNGEFTLLTDKSEVVRNDRQFSKEDNLTVDNSASLFISKRYGNKHLCQASGSYSNRQYSNSSEFEYWNYDSQNIESFSYRHEGLNYTQNVYRVAGRYSYMINNLSINFNLSAEQMINKGIFHSTDNSRLDYNEFNLYPAVSLVFRTKHKYKIGLKYSTRTLRPNINYLNPYVNYSDPQNITMGNPDLKAEFAHNFMFSINKTIGNGIRFELFSTAEFTNNAIESIITIDNKNVSTRTFDNIDTKANYYARISVTLEPYPWLNIHNSCQLSYSRFSNAATNMVNSFVGIGYNGSANFSIYKSASLSGNFSVFPQNSSAQTKEVKYYTSFGFQFSQTLIKDKLFLLIMLDEPFKNHRYISNIIGNSSFRMTTNREEPGRVLGISLRWNFGRFKQKVSVPNSDAVQSDLARPELSFR